MSDPGDELWGKTDYPPDPCTEGARDQGCTCRMESVHSASIDPPEPIADKNCPLHGWAPDPDDALEEQRELRADRPWWGTEV